LYTWNAVITTEENVPPPICAVGPFFALAAMRRGSFWGTRESALMKRRCHPLAKVVVSTAEVPLQSKCPLLLGGQRAASGVVMFWYQVPRTTGSLWNPGSREMKALVMFAVLVRMKVLHLKLHNPLTGWEGTGCSRWA
jgi:hypothetical protein